MNFLELKKVTKVYPNGTKAVQPTSLKIEKGEFMVFVGPSGCGKSTLLRMVAGLEDITTGDIKLDKKIINKIDPSERDVAMVFQNYALYPHMNVYNNLAYGLKNRGLAKDVIEKKVKAAAKLLQISDFLERKPALLSGGQRQRVAMGRAIVRSPKIFLFYEPLSNLDAKLRIQMRLEIKKLQRKVGVTSIFVTHDQVEAMTLADRLAVINNGIIEQLGTPIEIYNNPTSIFVAGFIGSPQMNFIEGELKNKKLKTQAFEIAGIKSDFNGKVILGFRPEHLVQAYNGLIKLNVDLVEKLGSDNLVYGETKGKKDLLCYRTPGNEKINSGSKLALNIQENKFYIFNTKTGKRII